MEYFDVLDEAGRKTGETISRIEAHRSGACHRVVQVWIMNSKNELLLQKRSANKDTRANCWYVSMGGHISAKESNELTILRELREELGFDAAPYTDKIKYLYTFHEVCNYDNKIVDNEIYDVYLMRHEIDLKDLVLQEEEVAEVRWEDYEDFKAAVLREDSSYVIHREGFALLLCHLDEIIHGATKSL